MQDTHSSMQLRFDQEIMKLSCTQRVQMGSSMFDAAKEIVRRSILNKNPGILQVELNKEMFLRFYGQEFNKNQKKNILDVLENEDRLRLDRELKKAENEIKKGKGFSLKEERKRLGISQ